MPNQISRRDWLRIMGIAAGTTALPLSSLARNEYGEEILLPENLPLKNPGKPITVITCGGEWVSARAEYDHRTLVRAVLLEDNA